MKHLKISASALALQVAVMAFGSEAHAGRSFAQLLEDKGCSKSVVSKSVSTDANVRAKIGRRMAADREGANGYYKFKDGLNDDAAQQGVQLPKVHFNTVMNAGGKEEYVKLLDDQADFSQAVQTLVNADFELDGKKIEDTPEVRLFMRNFFALEEVQNERGNGTDITDKVLTDKIVEIYEAEKKKAPAKEVPLLEDGPQGNFEYSDLMKNLGLEENDAHNQFLKDLHDAGYNLSTQQGITNDQKECFQLALKSLALLDADLCGKIDHKDLKDSLEELFKNSLANPAQDYQNPQKEFVAYLSGLFAIADYARQYGITDDELSEGSLDAFKVLCPNYKDQNDASKLSPAKIIEFIAYKKDNQYNIGALVDGRNALLGKLDQGQNPDKDFIDNNVDPQDIKNIFAMTSHMDDPDANKSEYDSFAEKLNNVIDPQPVNP